MEPNNDLIGEQASEMIPQTITSLSHAVCTDVGLVRTVNEDSYSTAETPNGYIYLVCDGLGGHSRGKTASQTAINQIIKLLNQQYFDDASLALKTAILHANQEIASLNHNKLELKRMGTTVVSALYRDGQIHLAHVGDSRIYLLRNGILRQLTHDHTYVQKLVDSQIITPQEAREHPKRSHLTQAVGVYYDTRPELAPHPLACQTGDILLLCTDGLTEMLDETEITETLLHTEGLQMTAETLVEQAKMAGGQDNITAMLVRIN